MRKIWCTYFISILLIILIIPYSSNSQGIVLEYQVGIRTYSMKDLKNFNNSIQTGLPFDSKIVSDFPPYLYFRPSISYNIKRIKFGLMLSFQSTGSKISSKDYSGNYFFKMKIKSIQYGFQINGTILKNEKLNISLSGLTGPIHSTLRIEEYLNVNDRKLIDDKYLFNSNNWFIEGGVITTKNINKNINFSAIISYHFQIGKQSFYHEQKEIILYDPITNIPIQPNWNGLVLGMSLGLKID
jgi:hypothetical protein